MLRTLWSLDGPGEPVGEYFARTRRAIALQGLEHHVVAALGIGRPIPGTVEGNEHPVAVMSGKLLMVIEHCAIGGPMRGEGRDRTRFAGADTNLFAPVPAVFRGQHELALHRVVVAFWPTIVAALLQQNQLFGRQRRFLLRLIQVGPIGMQLVSSVLGYVYALVGCVESKTFTVTNPGSETIGRSKGLLCLVGVIAPDPTAGLQFRTRIRARRLQRPVLQLAGVSRRAHIDVHGSIGSDGKGMHGMVAAQRQAGNDGSGGTLGHGRPRRQRIAHDAIVDLGVDRVLVEGNAGAAGCSGLRGFSKTLGWPRLA